MIYETFVPLYINNNCHSTCKICNYSKCNNQLKRYCASLNEIENQLQIIYNVEKIKAVCILTGEFLQGTVRSKNLELVIESIKIAFFIGFKKVYFNIGSLYDEEIELFKNCFIDKKESLILSLFQETYNKDVYNDIFGTNIGYSPKANFSFRLSTPERWIRAGFKSVDIGILIGINENVESDIQALCEHIKKLKTLNSSICISLPRVKGNIYQNKISDLEYLNIFKYLSSTFPNDNLIITTRESCSFIKEAMRYITIVSPGSSDLIPYTREGKIANKTETSQFVVKEKRDRPSEVLDKLETKFKYYKED